VVRDLLISKEMNGDSSSRTSFNSHVGAESDRHVEASSDPFRAELMSFSTSSLVTSLHSAMVGEDLYGTSYSGVAAVDARTALTLCLKKAEKSSAV